MMAKICALLLLAAASTIDAFVAPSSVIIPHRAFAATAASRRSAPLHMSEPSGEPTSTTSASASAAEEVDPMEAAMDDATREMMEKSRRSDELRAQEVFMKKSTGKHRCTNCDWEYDEKKGDSMMIGGMVKPGTPFAELPDNYRCPVCRASKDAFAEVVEEIPGFEVNQGYGFGTNAWSSGQKNLAIFGGLGLFFLLFLSGYAMS